MEIYSIGFTQKSASQFFELLKSHSIKRLLDVRLNNVSQLAGFSKRDDIAYFLREIVGAEYQHEPMLAPTQELLDAYKKQKGNWSDYERKFNALMAEREVDKRLDPNSFKVPTVLLCSEATPDHCHRRLVLDFLNERWGGVRAVHL